MRIMGCRNIYPFQYRIEQAHKFRHKYKAKIQKIQMDTIWPVCSEYNAASKAPPIDITPSPFANMTLQSREELGSVIVVYYRQDR